MDSVRSAQFVDVHLWRTEGRMVIVRDGVASMVTVLGLGPAERQKAIERVYYASTDVMWSEPTPFRIYDHLPNGRIDSWLNKNPWIVTRTRSADGVVEATYMV